MNLGPENTGWKLLPRFASALKIDFDKALAGFLNTSGGTFVIGVADDGSPVGVEADKFPNEDNMGLHLVNLVKSRMSAQAMTEMHLRFDEHGDRTKG